MPMENENEVNSNLDCDEDYDNSVENYSELQNSQVTLPSVSIHDGNILPEHIYSVVSDRDNEVDSRNSTELSTEFLPFFLNDARFSSTSDIPASNSIQFGCDLSLMKYSEYENLSVIHPKDELSSTEEPVAGPSGWKPQQNISDKCIKVNNGNYMKSDIGLPNNLNCNRDLNTYEGCEATSSDASSCHIYSPGSAGDACIVSSSTGHVDSVSPAPDAFQGNDVSCPASPEVLNLSSSAILDATVDSTNERYLSSSVVTDDASEDEHNSPRNLSSSLFTEENIVSNSVSESNDSGILENAENENVSPHCSSTSQSTFIDQLALSLKNINCKTASNISEGNALSSNSSFINSFAVAGPSNTVFICKNTTDDTDVHGSSAKTGKELSKPIKKIVVNDNCRKPSVLSSDGSHKLVSSDIDSQYKNSSELAHTLSNAQYSFIDHDLNSLRESYMLESQSVLCKDKYNSNDTRNVSLLSAELEPTLSSTMGFTFNAEKHKEHDGFNVADLHDESSNRDSISHSPSSLFSADQDSLLIESEERSANSDEHLLMIVSGVHSVQQTLNLGDAIAVQEEVLCRDSSSQSTSTDSPSLIYSSRDSNDVIYKSDSVSYSVTTSRPLTLNAVNHLCRDEKVINPHSLFSSAAINQIYKQSNNWKHLDIQDSYDHSSSFSQDNTQNATAEYILPVKGFSTTHQVIPLSSEESFTELPCQFLKTPPEKLFTSPSKYMKQCKEYNEDVSESNKKNSNSLNSQLFKISDFETVDNDNVKAALSSSYTDKLSSSGISADYQSSSSCDQGIKAILNKCEAIGIEINKISSLDKPIEDLSEFNGHFVKERSIKIVRKDLINLTNKDNDGGITCESALDSNDHEWINSKCVTAEAFPTLLCKKSADQDVGFFTASFIEKDTLIGVTSSVSLKKYAKNCKSSNENLKISGSTGDDSWIYSLKKSNSNYNCYLKTAEKNVYIVAYENIAPASELILCHDDCFPGNNHKEANNKKLWECYECNEILGSAAVLQQHLDSHDKKLRRKRVKRIDAGNESKSKRSSTVIVVDGEPNLETVDSASDKESLGIFCNICCLIFTSSVVLDIHMLCHRVKDMKMHLLSVSLESCRKCPECGYLSESEDKLLNHILKHSKMKIFSDASSSQNPNKCDVCRKSFRVPEKLKIHKSVHVSDPLNPYICPQCYRRFRTSVALLCHSKIHSETNYIHDCPVCRKIFPSICSLKQHFIEHLHNDSYACPSCSKNFPSYSKIRRHIRSYHPDQRHECHLCRKDLPSIDKLKLHLLTHSNKKDFLCPKCGKQFRRKDKMKDHMKRMHSEGREEKKTPKFKPKVDPSNYKMFPYHCQLCHLGFKRRGMLINHMVKRHPSIPISSIPELNQPIVKTSYFYRCHYCNKVYKNTTKHKNHVLKDHPGCSVIPQEELGSGKKLRTFIHSKDMKLAYAASCQWCHRQYYTRAKLYQHQRSKHWQQYKQHLDAEKSLREMVKIIDNSNTSNANSNGEEGTIDSPQPVSEEDTNSLQVKDKSVVNSANVPQVNALDHATGNSELSTFPISSAQVVKLDHVNIINDETEYEHNTSLSQDSQPSVVVAIPSSFSQSLIVSQTQGSSPSTLALLTTDGSQTFTLCLQSGQVVPYVSYQNSQENQFVDESLDLVSQGGKMSSVLEAVSVEESEVQSHMNSHPDIRLCSELPSISS